MKHWLASSTLSFGILAGLFAAPAAPASLGDCGQPLTNGDSPAASDCLFVLKSAVGSADCPDCLCDTTGAGGVLSSDALLCLRVAVGQPLALSCPPCASTTTTTLPDIDPPVVVSAEATSGTTVEVVFDEPLSAFSIDSNDFLFDKGVVALSAELQPDSVTVVVTTTALAAGTSYIVIVGGVTDVAGNEIGAENAAMFTTAP